MKGQSDTDIEILRMMITEGRGGKLEQSREGADLFAQELDF